MDYHPELSSLTNIYKCFEMFRRRTALENIMQYLELRLFILPKPVCGKLAMTLTWTTECPAFLKAKH